MVFRLNLIVRNWLNCFQFILAFISEPFALSQYLGKCFGGLFKNELRHMKISEFPENIHFPKSVKNLYISLSCIGFERGLKILEIL
jgi:hypothetical protein